jgi:hypothetical protein
MSDVLMEQYLKRGISCASHTHFRTAAASTQLAAAVGRDGVQRRQWRVLQRLRWHVPGVAELNFDTDRDRETGWRRFHEAAEQP